MKNIHIIPTDKPSRLYKIENKLGLLKEPNRNFLAKNQHIYITSDEEVKVGDWVITNGGFRFVTKLNNDKIKSFIDDGTISKQSPSPYCRLEYYKKIILTTDQDLIKDGVQAIDDIFLEWFVENPSCEYVKTDLVPVNEFGSEITVGGYGFDKFIYKIIIPQEEIIADKDVKDFSDKFTEGYNRVVPKHLREDKPIDKEKEKSFGDWVQRLRDRLGWNKF